MPFQKGVSGFILLAPLPTWVTTMTITLYSWVNHKLRREHPNGYLVDLKVAPESLVRSMVALVADD